MTVQRWLRLLTFVLAVSLSAAGAVRPAAADPVPVLVVLPVTDAQPYVSGRTEPGTAVLVFLNDNLIGGAPATGSNFLVEIPRQKAGTILKVVAYGPTGNVSEPFNLIVRDATPPPPAAVDQVGDNHTEVTGTAEPGATVLLYVQNRLLASGTADAAGQFRVPIKPLALGTVLQVIVRDAAGNKSQARLYYVRDTTPPATPRVDPVSAEQSEVTGSTDPFVRVTVRSGEQQLAQGTSDLSGQFRLPIAPQAAGAVLTVIADDSRENYTPPVRVQVTPAGTWLLPTEKGHRLIRFADRETVALTEAVAADRAVDLMKEGLVFDLSLPTVTLGQGGAARTGRVTEVSLAMPGEVLQRAADLGQKVVLLTPFARVEIPAAAAGNPVRGTTVTFRLRAENPAGGDRTAFAAAGMEPRGSIVCFEVQTAAGGQTTVVERLHEAALLAIPLERGAATELAGVYLQNPAAGGWERTATPVTPGRPAAEAAVTVAGRYLLGQYTRRFADVPDTHPLAREIMWMAARGLVRGKDGDRFEPEAPVTRAEFAALLVRSFGLAAADSGGNPAFADVPPDQWFAPDVAAAARAGLVQGEGGRFRPGDPVRREELAVVLERILTARGRGPAVTEATRQQWAEFYRDSGSSSPWAWAAITSTSELGILTGHGYSFEPAVAATRAEVAAALRRVLAIVQQ